MRGELAKMFPRDGFGLEDGLQRFFDKLLGEQWSFDNNICDFTDDCLSFVSWKNRLPAPFCSASGILSSCGWGDHISWSNNVCSGKLKDQWCGYMTLTFLFKKSAQCPCRDKKGHKLMFPIPLPSWKCKRFTFIPVFRVNLHWNPQLCLMWCTYSSDDTPSKLRWTLTI